MGEEEPREEGGGGEGVERRRRGEGEERGRSSRRRGEVRVGEGGRGGSPTWERTVITVAAAHMRAKKKGHKNKNTEKEKKSNVGKLRWDQE